MVPGVCGEPVAWMMWTAVCAGSALAPTRWRAILPVAAVTMAAGSCFAAQASLVAPVLASLVFAWSLTGLGRVAGRLESPLARAGTGAALSGLLVAVDAAAAATRGTLGHALDLVAPSVGLEAAVRGELPLSGVAVLGFGGVLAWGLRGCLDARGGGLANGLTTAILAPLVWALAGSAAAPLPALHDGTINQIGNLHPATVGALHRLDSPLLLSVLHTVPPDSAARSVDRHLERLILGLERASLKPLSAQRLHRVATAEFLAAEGIELPPATEHALQIRALDRTVLVLLKAEGLQGSVARALWGLAPRQQPGQVLVVGDPLPGLDLGRVVQPAHPQDEPPPPDTDVIVVVPSAAGLSPAGLAMLDAHVMGGGGLVVLYGEPMPDGPRRGVPLTDPWGFHAEGALPSGSGEASGIWAEAGFGGMTIPAGTPAITGPEGLGDTVSEVGGEAVAVAMLGSVPSGVPGGAREQSQGAVRVFLTSASLSAANPALAARGLDWVLDESELSGLRGGAPHRDDRGRMMLLMMALLPGLAVLGVSAGRIQREEPA